MAACLPYNTASLRRACCSAAALNPLQPAVHSYLTRRPSNMPPLLAASPPACPPGCIVVSCSAFILLLLERRGARWLEALFGLVIGVEAVRFFCCGCGLVTSCCLTVGR